jgi:hypothetical protein
MFGMNKTGIINFRVSEEERKRYERLVYERRKPLSQIIRESLDRMAKRLEKERGAAE